MTRQELLGSIGEFSWNFGQKFFVETKFGNFVWSDPGYSGDNTFTKFDGSYAQFCEQEGIEFCRGKGKKHISSKCGDQITVVGFNLDTNPLGEPNETS